MKNARKKSSKEVKPSIPGDTSVRKDNDKKNASGTATYFWHDANNRNLLRRRRTAVGSEGDSAKHNDSVPDGETKPNLYVYRTTVHKTISQTLYRRQKVKS